MIREYKNKLGVRFATTELAYNLMIERNVKNIVETGTARDIGNWNGDGLSTFFFGDYCNRYGGHVWTCDISPEAIRTSQLITKLFSDYITYITKDSLIFLKEFIERIDLLYLDSFDSVKGMEEQASQHNLNEVKIILNKLHENTIVFIDDYHPNKNTGKGIYSVPFLIENGWKLLNNYGYQAVLIKK